MASQFQQLKHPIEIPRSINKTLEAICQTCCNPSNDSGFCLPPCWEICPSKCSDPFSLYPPPSPAPHKPHTPNKTVIIVFTLLAVASLALFLYFVHAKRRSRRSRAPPLVTETHEEFFEEEYGPVVDHPIWYIRTVGLQPSVINLIAVFKYKKGDGLVEVTDCPVCLSEFQEDEILRLLPKCSHAFHIPCIDTWLRSHTNCPLCRAPVVVPTARAPSPEVNSGDSSVSGETRLDIHTLEENRGPEGEIEDAGREIELNRREEAAGLAGASGGIDTEPARRSFSFDCSEASKIWQAIALTSSDESSADVRSENELAKGKELGQGSDSKRIGGSQRFLRLVGSSPIGRSLRSGPIFLKRSDSCYGESSLPRVSGSFRSG